MTGLMKTVSRKDEKKKKKKKEVHACTFVRMQGTPGNSARTRVKLRRVLLTVLVCREISTILRGRDYPLCSRRRISPARRWPVMYIHICICRVAYVENSFDINDPLWSIRFDHSFKHRSTKPASSLNNIKNNCCVKRTSLFSCTTATTRINEWIWQCFYTFTSIYTGCPSIGGATEEIVILHEKNKSKVKDKNFSLEASLSGKSTFLNIHRIRVHYSLDKWISIQVTSRL